MHILQYTNFLAKKDNHGENGEIECILVHKYWFWKEIYDKKVKKRV
jgi:hypothetical protein